MKSFKKVLALVLACAMMLSSMTAFAAKANMYGSEANVLHSLGLFKGVSTDEFVPNLEGGLDKGDTLLLMARVFGWDLDSAKDQEVTFEDAKMYQLPAVKYAVKNDILKGINEKEMGQDVTVRVLATMVLRELGFDATEAWNNAIEYAVTEDILSISEAVKANEAALRDNAVGMFYKSLEVTPQGGNMTVIEALVKAGDVDQAKAVQLGLMAEPKPVDLAVEVKEASNLKEVVLSFNKEIKEAKKENFTVNGAEVAEAKLADDKMTVTLTLVDGKETKNQEESKLVVKDIKAVDGTSIKKEEIKFTAFDAELPEVTGIEFVGPKQFKITFNEPVKADKPVVSVKSGKYTISAAVDAPVGNTALVTVGAKLKDGETYTIRVEKAKDYADYSNLVYMEDVEYVAQKDAPTMEVVEYDQKQVKVKFSVPVENVTEDNFYHTFSAWKPVEVVAKDAAKTFNQEFTVKFVDDSSATKDYPLPVGKIEFNVLTKANSKEIKDAWGNKIQDQVVTLDVAADREAPEVTGIKVVDKDTLEITFNKALNEAGDTDNYVVYDDEDKDMELSLAASFKDSDAKIVVLELNKDLTGKTIKVEVKDLVDNTLYENKMTAYVETLEIGDKDFAGIKSAEFIGKDLYVTFEEAVTDSAIDKDNYKLTDNKIDEISFFADKIVKLTFEDDVNSGDTLSVVDITDLAGNSSGKFAITKTTAALTSATIEKVEVKSKNTVSVEFSRELAVLDRESFSIEQVASATTSSAASMTYEVKDGKTVVELTLEDGKEFTATDVTDVVVTVTDEDLKDIFDKAVEADTKNATSVDKWAPELVKDGDKEAIVTDVAGTEDVKVTVKFNEAVKANSVGLNDIKVDGKEIKDFTLVDGGMTLEITVKGEVSKLDGKSVVINTLSDVAGNYTEKLTFKIAD